MTDRHDETIRSAIATMVAEAPTPAEFDQLTAVTAIDAAAQRRWSPIAAMAVGFVAAIVAIGAVLMVGLPFNDSPVGGDATIFVVPSYMPDGLVLRVGEVSPEGDWTTQIYSGDIRTVSINVSDMVAIAEQSGNLSDGALERLNDSSEFFRGLLATLDDVYSGQQFTYEEIEVRGRHSFLFERTETSAEGEPVVYVGVVTAEGNGIYSETNAQNLSRQEAVSVAESLHPIAKDGFPVLSWP